MKKYFSQVKLVSFVTSIFLIIFGIVLMCLPKATMSAIGYALGILLLIVGIVKIVDYFVYGVEPFAFANGLFFISLALLCLCANQTLCNPSLFAFFAGIFFTVKSILNIQNSIDYHRMGIKNWWVDLLCNAILFFFGIVIISNPFATARILYFALGLTILIDGICKLATTLLVTYKVNKVKRSLHTFAQEPTIIYVEDNNDKI